VSKNLFISLFISLILHGLLFLGLTGVIVQKKEVYAKKQGQAAIKIRLSVYKEPTRMTPPKPVSKKGKRKIKKEQLKKKQVSQASKSKVKETKGSDKILAKYLSQVREAIMRKKIKLRMAKRLRLKGDVGLYFLLKKPNIIEGVRVLKTSTYPQLDQSALATMEAVEEIPMMPSELELDQIPITVVISYQ
tara:strand:+ start:1753 stop:2322 length:570 start_codon:yes stop_codon:yes gene_type:complete